MSRIVQTKAGPYKMRHRLPSINRLLRYENPLPMVGDPDIYYKANERGWWPGHPDKVWERRALAIYEAMMEEKRGIVPRDKRVGLWMHIIPTTKS